MGFARIAIGSAERPSNSPMRYWIAKTIAATASGLFCEDTMPERLTIEEQGALRLAGWIG